MDSALLLAAARLPRTGTREASPSSIPRPGWVVRATACKLQGGRAQARLQCLPPYPARARSCARLYLRHSAAARLHSLDAPLLLPLTTRLGLADSWEGQQGRRVAFSWALCL